MMNDKIAAQLDQFFGTNSSNVPDVMKLAVAANFIPVLERFLDKADTTIKDDWSKLTASNEASQDLHDLFNHYHSDKAAHGYHLLYAKIFEQLGRDNKIKLLEIGIGTNKPGAISGMGEQGKPGASGFSFAEYLPNASIYMADIDNNILINEGRIQSSFVDQLNPRTFERLDSNFNNIDYDLIIDDGLHNVWANLNTIYFGIEHLKPNGWMVIEDIRAPLISTWRVIDAVLSQVSGYDRYFAKAEHSWVYLLNKTD